MIEKNLIGRITEMPLDIISLQIRKSIEKRFNKRITTSKFSGYLHEKDINFTSRIARCGVGARGPGLLKEIDFSEKKRKFLSVKKDEATVFDKIDSNLRKEERVLLSINADFENTGCYFTTEMFLDKEKNIMVEWDCGYLFQNDKSETTPWNLIFNSKECVYKGFSDTSRIWNIEDGQKRLQLLTEIYNNNHKRIPLQVGGISSFIGCQALVLMAIIYFQNKIQLNAYQIIGLGGLTGSTLALPMFKYWNYPKNEKKLEESLNINVEDALSGQEAINKLEKLYRGR